MIDDGHRVNTEAHLEHFVTLTWSLGLACNIIIPNIYVVTLISINKHRHYSNEKVFLKIASGLDLHPETLKVKLA